MTDPRRITDEIHEACADAIAQRPYGEDADLTADAALAAVYPLIERAVIERLAGEAGENPYEIAESVGAWGSSKLAWERGAAAAAGVAAERARLLSDAAVERAAGKLRTSGGYRDEDGDGFVLRDARAALSAALGVWE